MTAAEAANLTELMRDVVVEGTGSSVRTDAYTVAAKTGTAEFETGKETHAWFTGFADADGRRVYFCVYLGEPPEQDVSSTRAKEIALQILSASL